MRQRNVWGLAAGLLLLGTVRAHAQNNVVKIDIFQPIVKTAALAYEHKISESSSFQLGLAITANYQEDNYSNDERKTSGFSITPEYRFYLSDKHPAMEGFYVAPYLRYQYLSQQGYYDSYGPTGPSYRQNTESSLHAFGGGAVVGRHWIFKQRFSLDAYLGPSYMVSGVSSNTPSIDRNDFLGYYENVNYGIRGGLTFGIAF